MSMAPATVFVTAGRFRRGLFSLKWGALIGIPSISVIPGELISDGVRAWSETPRPDRRPGAHFRDSRPTVYLAFNRVVENGKPGVKDDVLLELHNNTRWNILYHVLPGGNESPEVKMLYKVEDVAAFLFSIQRGCVTLLKSRQRACRGGGVSDSHRSPTRL
jgi:hypothetical protein